MTGWHDNNEGEDLDDEVGEKMVERVWGKIKRRREEAPYFFN